MAFTNIVTHADPTTFGALSTRWEGLSYRRVRCDDADGTWHAYQAPDTSIVGQSLVIPSPAKAAAMQVIADANEAARTTDANKRTIAINAVRAELTRIKAIAAGSRTSTEKSFLGLCYLLLTEE